ncbi:MAG TPA: hypothetical protein VK095_16915 [Beutenbergiaceae bacterium]|nr:hypothetical protein [Beutenbergiaceae bacterium]
MTEHTITLDAGDHRRALAALSHYLHDDLDGVAASLGEANETGRRLELLLAVLSTTANLLPELRSPLGVQLLRDHLLHAANQEGTN